MTVIKRLFAFVAVTAASALLVAGSVVAVSTIFASAVHHSASASEDVLPSIASQMQVGSVVYADDGKTVLATLSGPEFRKPIPLADVSKVTITAVLDTEDHNFYLHGGFSIPAIVRAAVSDSSGSGLQGGSTIPQQLVKQLYLSPTRKLSRKIKEAVLADRLEQKYSKDQILQAYLNTIYLGRGSYGIEAAAETWFQEPARALTLPQAALLAGMIQNPTGYDPVSDPVDARHRRAEVLQRMVVYGDITQAQAASAAASPLPVLAAPPPTDNAVLNYYVQEVKTQLLDDSSSPLGSTYQDRYDALFEGGLRIYTNLDPTMQSAAENAVARDTPANSGGYLETLVSVEPSTGKVKALVGGAPSQHYDIVTDGRRQPGSGFKLMTLLAALQQNYSVYDTVDGDSPCAIKFPGDNDLVKKPIKNDNTTEGGVQTIVKATANSVNCAYIRLAHEVGLSNVIAMANALGVASVTQQDQFPSTVIGAIPVHPLEMAGAYATVAAGGVYHQPRFIDHIVDRSGDVIYQADYSGHRVFSTQVAAEADVALRAVVQYGTGTAASLYNRPVAGKTGTTENNHDAWFNGFTPQLETTVWIGNEKQEIPIVIDGAPVYGAGYPARTWHDYSAAVLADDPVVALPQVDNGLLPATRYVTSPSLVAADVGEHNLGGGYNSYCANYSYSSQSGSGCTSYPTSPYRSYPTAAPTTAAPTQPGTGGTTPEPPPTAGPGPGGTSPPTAGPGPGGTAPPTKATTPGTAPGGPTPGSTPGAG